MNIYYIIYTKKGALSEKKLMVLIDGRKNTLILLLWQEQCLCMKSSTGGSGTDLHAKEPQGNVGRGGVHARGSCASQGCSSEEWW